MRNPYKSQAAVKARHRKALKASIRRNGGTSSQRARDTKRRHTAAILGHKQPVSVNTPVFAPLPPLLQLIIPDWLKQPVADLPQPRVYKQYANRKERVA